MLRKAFLIAQILVSVAVIIFGVAYSLRCLLAGQFFCAIGFAFMAYVSGYSLMLKTSIKEYRQFLNSRRIVNED